MNIHTRFGKGLVTLFTMTALSLVLLFIFPLDAWAEEGGAAEGDEEPRNWELIVGGHVFREPEYEGSGELEFMVFPLIVASYEIAPFELFIEGDEAGVKLRVGGDRGAAIAAGVGLGEGRKSDDADRLKGTPEVHNYVNVFGGLETELPWEIRLLTRAKYFPITAEYAGTDREDEEYGGLLIDLSVERDWLVIPVFCEIGVGCSWMNQDYAEGIFGLESDSPHLKAYDAEAGLHDAHFSATVMLFFSEHLGIITTAEGRYLLASAGESPFTERQLQPEIHIGAFYAF